MQDAVNFLSSKNRFCAAGKKLTYSKLIHNNPLHMGLAVSPSALGKLQVMHPVCFPVFLI